MLIKTGFYRSIEILVLAALMLAGLPALCAQEIDPRPFSSAESALQELRLERMLLLLRPTTQQRNDLDTLLAEQQTPGDARYHKWLTTTQFAERFAISERESTTVADWLKSQGFEVAALPASRGWIEFSGTSVQVEQAFQLSVEPIVSLSGPGSEMQRYEVKGSLKIPSSLASMVEGLVSLDGSLSYPATTTPTEIHATFSELAAQSSIHGADALTPAPTSAWLNLGSLQTDGINGAGQRIAIPARSNVHPQDFDAFRKSFGLPAQTLSVAVSGKDPGLTGEEASAIESISWAGLAAPLAQIMLVPASSTNATDGVDLALASIIDGSLADTISVGYTSCEESLSPAHQEFYAALYRQAAAKGISIVAATGDSGASACHRPESGTTVSTGLNVNGLASTPWNTAIGAVAFAEDTGSMVAWQQADGSDATNRAYATGGGFSEVYATPQWQTAAGVPSTDLAAESGQAVASSGTSPIAHHRYLPDLGLPTAVNGFATKGMVFCFMGSSTAGDAGSGDCHLMSASGSAISSAVFAGVSALLAQKYGPQGNLAPNLYALSRRTDARTDGVLSAIVDVTSGSSKLPCLIGSRDCSYAGTDVGEIGFNAQNGYDLASGLGSIDIQAMVEQWPNPLATSLLPTVTTLTALPAAIVSGTPEVLTVTIAPATATATYTITGTVAFYDGSTLLGTAAVSANGATLTALLSNTTSHSITAVYSGDSTYATSTSTPLVLASTFLPVTVTLTESSGVLTPEQPVTLVATVTPVNTPPLTAEQHPSGYVLFYAGTTLISDQVPVVVGTGYSSVASTTVPHLPAGQYIISAQYYGDPTYAPGTSNSLTLQVEDFAIATNITNIDITQGASATVPYTVTSLGGLTGQIQITCAEQNPPAVGAIGCQFTPSVINGTGTTTLTITTTAGNVSSNDRSPSIWPATGGGIALAFVCALLTPIGRRAAILTNAGCRRLMVLIFLLVGLAGAGLGCSNSVTITKGSGGTPLGVATLKITAGALVNTVTETHSAYLTVNVQP